MKHHILIVEDDDKIRRLLQQYLKSQGYLVSSVGTIKDCAKIYKYFKFDLIILDIMLPDGTGVKFINQNRDKIDVPVIIVSALGHVDDRVYALESGARDYITKPFELRELLLRIKNLISENSKSHEVIFGDFAFDLNSKILVRNGTSVHLTHSEKELMSLFCKNLKTVITRVEFANHFADLNDRTIDTMIARLRNKIEADPKSPRHLITERNKGYSLWP
ncbi:MAG: response regulator transcription factor [Candidatus Jidaibacter sp.]|jgi:two-component system phosphate regulon response regulator OmpR|nr:response regulator transcription factor [Candidatus Jidaibacter sp.]